MTEIRFTIPCRISGKGRPRSAIVNGQMRVYTPAKTRAEERMIATLAKAAMHGSKPLEGPVWLDVAIIQRPPPSWSLAKQRASNWVVQKPDASNRLKMIEDAINGIVYVDDCQIAKISMEQVWRISGDERVEVRIKSLQ